MEDSEIIDLYLQREERAIAETQKKYGASLTALAQRLLESREDAQECENDTYLAAWNAIPPQEPRDYFHPWLLHITRNRALDLLRRRNRQKRSAHVEELSQELLAVLPSPDGEEQWAERLDLGEAIDRFLTFQKKRDRIIFLRRYWFCETVPEIAKLLHISQGSVKSSLHRTRKKLRTWLEEQEVYYEGRN